MATTMRDDMLKDFWRFRVVGNVPQNPAPVCVTEPGTGTPYQLLVAEFDDQGLCFFERGSLAQLDAVLTGYAGGAAPIILVFTHGWKNNGAPDNDNLMHFKALLASVAAREAGSRPVLGVYIAWRGLSTDGNWAWMQASFPGRAQAADRVALGSPRELLGRLRAFRQDFTPLPGAPEVTLVIIGHSFGGRIVYAALAQSLIEAASTQNEIVPSFADLVLLVNPAFSAVSYLPVWDIVRHRGFAATQIPVFVSVTAKNDLATGVAYPLGNALRLLQEQCATPQEREALIRTMGHIPWLQTHELSDAPPPPRTHGTAHAAFCALGVQGQVENIGGVAVRALPGGTPNNPFWVATATPAVVDGHCGIFRPLFEGFIYDLVAAHIQKAALRAVPPTPLTAPPPLTSPAPLTTA